MFKLDADKQEWHKVAESAFGKYGSGKVLPAFEVLLSVSRPPTTRATSCGGVAVFLPARLGCLT